MYKDIISYELAENVTKEHLIAVAKQVVDSWMKFQSGFIRWEITENKDGSLIDIVYWKTKEDAKQAEKDMVNIPDAGEWFGCYKQGSITSENVTTIATF